MPADRRKPASKRYALITGAGSGLGREFSLRLARDGWHVAVTDVDLVAAERTLSALVEAGGDGQVELLDVTSLDAWQQLVDRLRAEWPQLDLLINNAGICGSGVIGDGGLHEFEAIMDVNFRGTLNGCQTMVPWLKDTAPGGHIVNIASIFGLIAPPGMGAYNCSKAAVVALSETLFGELRRDGIGVTVAAPGFFASKLIVGGTFASDADRELAERYTNNSRISATDVVDQTLVAIDRGQLYVVLGGKARWMWRVKRMIPGRFGRLLHWRFRRKMRSVTDDD